MPYKCLLNRKRKMDNSCSCICSLLATFSQLLSEPLTWCRIWSALFRSIRYSSEASSRISGFDSFELDEISKSHIIGIVNGSEFCDIERSRRSRANRICSPVICKFTCSLRGSFVPIVFFAISFTYHIMSKYRVYPILYDGLSKKELHLQCFSQ